MAEALIALVALTVMEIVLGIDNIVVISIITSKLPQEQRPHARRLGLGLAMFLRIALLLTIQQIMRLTDPIWFLTDWGVPASWLASDLSTHQFAEINGVSWRDLIMLVGGLFLLGKTVHEIHSEIEAQGMPQDAAPLATSFRGALLQIVILDVVFSLDSVITAVGMANQIWVMIVAVVLAVGVMMVFAGRVADFIERHPTVKMLALSFLILIAVMLVAESLGTHVNKGYVYFAMAFSLGVEFLNMRARGKSKRTPIAA